MSTLFTTSSLWIPLQFILTIQMCTFLFLNQMIYEQTVNMRKWRILSWNCTCQATRDNRKVWICLKYTFYYYFCLSYYQEWQHTQNPCGLKYNYTFKRIELYFLWLKKLVPHFLSSANRLFVVLNYVICGENKSTCICVT